MNVVYKDQTGAALIDWILRESQGALSIFFIQPNVLWCGLVYTPYSFANDQFGLTQVNYELGWNCPLDNDLRIRVPQDDPTQLSYGKRMPQGTKIFSQSQLTAAKRKLTKMLNKIPDKAWLQKLADEKEKRINYAGYEGTLRGFLQPYAAPGYTAFVKDKRYPELTGNYVIESVVVEYGTSGARRNVELGPRVGFASESAWKRLTT
ncbi:MAG: hypothetical protein EBZ77_16660 [Chitinophagia bacterium]|nr:hypothetical protein [Chitinophagia bacterium]